ncbi:MAG: LysR family transcriptional regulator [Rhodospirillaceae bacterium]|nr:LysR family transcriptional regulator [Rhodospirillaceae bacterium]
MPAPRPPFDLDLLRTFVEIADSGSFTRAAERVGRSQPTVSLQMKKLEQGLGRRVFERENGGAGGQRLLTTEGEILLNYARQVLHLCDEARARIMEPEVEGLVRLGTPEDFATSHLPDILARFARAHPRVALAINCDFTVNLLSGFSRGEYDLVLFKREPQGRLGSPAAGPEDGVGVWREGLVWAANARLVLDDAKPLPLVLAPAPDVYRRRAIAALDAAERKWQVVFTSPSLAGLQAAVRAGLGLSVLPREMVPDGAVVLAPREHRLPELPDTEIVLYKMPGKISRPATLLAEHIVHSLEGGVKAVADD